METTIKDGTGKGFSAAVNSENMVLTESLTIKQIAFESDRHGDAYVLNTGFVNLTNTAIQNQILYFKNTSGENLFVEKVRVCGGLAMDVTMQCLVTANPTAGTIISDAVPALKASLNLSSSNEFEGLAYLGGDGKTATGGYQLSNFQGHAPGHSIQEYDGALILGRNDAVSISVKPSAALSVCVEVICFVK